MDGLGDVRALLAEGRNLEAFDAASRLTSSRNVVEQATVRYLCALALARSGAIGRALDELTPLGDALEGLPMQLVEDIGGLRARSVKDLAILRGAAGRGGFRRAADLYESVFRRCGGAYSCINAATCRLLAGETDRAHALARAAARIAESQSVTGEGRFWSLATRAEAALVLGDVDGCRHAVEAAAALDGVGAGQRASTRRQLRVICAALGLDDSALLAPLANATVLHYCGAMQLDEGPAGAAIDAWWEDRRVGDAYGSLARGADLLVAEAALRRQVRLHVVLPFAPDEFVERSVRSDDPAWVTRFERCLTAASSVTIASDSASMGHDEVFSYGSDIAMGTALTRARDLDAEVVQLALWDGVHTELVAGTARDVDVWRSAGGITAVLPLPPTSHGSSASEPGRVVRSILFGDFAGFSKLADQHYPAFISRVMDVVAVALEPHGGSIRFRNTWGDGIVLVLDDVATAARVAVEVQEALAKVDLAGVGLPDSLRLRLSAHAGPVFEVDDPVTGTRAVMGRELTRGARIEPQTPTGQIYASEAFAALLALVPGASVRAEYVGRITTAKAFETVPVFVLQRSGPAPDGAGPSARSG